MEHPLARLALAYGAGLVLAFWSPFPVSLGALLLVTLAVGYGCLRAEKLRPFLLWPFLIFCGWTNLELQTAVISPADLRVLNDGRDELLTLHGTLVEAPRQSIVVRRGEETVRTLAILEATELQRGTNREPAFGQVLVNTPGVVGDEFFTGRAVVLSGVLRVPRGPVAEGLFDYRRHLAWQGIHRQLVVADTNDWQFAVGTDPAARPPLADRFQTWAMATLARGLPVEDVELRLLWAMALGWKTALTDEVTEPFMRSGTMHIFAISGLHIALIAGILVSLLRVLQVPRGACGWIVIPLIWFYTHATGWQSSAIRSTIMMTVIIAGWMLHRPGNLLNSLAASGFIILLWEPQQLFQASFQLSFFVVLSIGLLLPPFEKIRQRLLRHDPLIPHDALPRWRRWVEPPVLWVTASLATSLAAWLGSLPLIAWYFHMVTPVSLLANLLVVPLSSLALMCNLGSLVTGAALPWVAEMFNHSAWFWMRLMIRASDWTITLPTAFFYVRPPTAAQFFLFYSALLAVTAGWLTDARRRWWVAAGLAVLAVFCGWEWNARRDRFDITVLAGATAVYVDAPGTTEDMLVDCGTDSSVTLVLKPFLRCCGVNRLPVMVLSHGDTRHVGGATNLAELFAVERVVASQSPSRSPAYRQAVAAFAAEPARLARVARGGRVQEWEVLHPAAEDRFAQGDDNAVVLRREIRGTRVLLLSDLGRLGQRALLERANESDLRADIVIAGLPAQGEPLSPQLLAAIQPRLVIIHDTEFPAKLRAGAKLRERLRQAGVPVMFTGDSGTVSLSLTKRGWEVRAMNGERSSGSPQPK